MGAIFQEFFEKLKMIIDSPTKFFNSVKKEEIEPAFKYYAVLLLIPVAIMLILGLTLGLAMLNIAGMAGIIPGIGALIVVAMAVVFYILGLAGSFISSAIIHIFAYLLGAKKGFRNTYKAVVYGATPATIFAFIPIVNIIFIFWSMYLEIKGISILQDMPMGRALLAVILPIVVIGGAVLLLSLLALGVAAPIAWAGY